MSSATAGEPGSVADTRIDPASVWAGIRIATLDPTAWLARLRTEFPHWAFFYDPWASAWIAVRGRLGIEVAATAIELRDAIGARRR